LLVRFDLSVVRKGVVLTGLFGSACLLLAGCTGDTSGLGTVHPVSGTVTVGDKPASKGSVAFHPQQKDAGYIPAGEIDEQGKYTLNTRGKTGAPPGTYKVVVSIQVPSDPKDPYSLPKSQVDAIYTKAETTPLTVTVKESPAPGDYDLKLKK